MNIMFERVENRHKTESQTWFRRSRVFNLRSTRNVERGLYIYKNTRLWTPSFDCVSIIICIQRLDEYESDWKADSIKPIWAVCPALPGESAQWGRNVCSYHVPARDDFPVPALIQRPLHPGWGLLRLSSNLCKGHSHRVLHTLWSTMINQCHTQRLKTVRCLSIFFVYQTNPAPMPASPSQCCRCPSSPCKLCTSEGGFRTLIFMS